MNNPKMIKVMYRFLFGVTQEQFQEEVKKDDDQARNMLDQLDDEPIDLLNDRQENDEQDVSPEMNSDMSLQLSKLNFKAKNQASALSIHEPFADKFRQQEVQKLIQVERNEKIMAIFNNLDLDEDEQDFLDSE